MLVVYYSASLQSQSKNPMIGGFYAARLEEDDFMLFHTHNIIDYLHRGIIERLSNELGILVSSKKNKRPFSPITREYYE